MTDQTRLSDTAVLHRALELLRLALVQVEDCSENEWVMDTLTGQSVTTEEIHAFLLRHGMPTVSRASREFARDNGGLQSAYQILFEDYYNQRGGEPRPPLTFWEAMELAATFHDRGDV